MYKAVKILEGPFNFICAICGPVGLLFTLYPRSPESSVIAGAPWWALALLALGCGGPLLVFANNWLRRRHERTIAGEFLTAAQDLFAHVHEAGLRGRFSFGPDVGANRTAPLPDVQRFRGILLALDAPCAALGLFETREAIRHCLGQLTDTVDCTHANNQMGGVATILRNEVRRGLRLAVAPDPH